MSSVTTLARPYAKASFEVAHAADALAPWADALAFAAAVAADERVRHAIGEPNVDNADLKALFVPADGAPEGFEALLTMLTDNDRLPVLPEIATLYGELKDEAEQTLHVTVRSAHALDDAYTKRIREALGKRFGKTIDLACEVDEEMLGGAVVTAGDRVIDGSLSGKLSRLADSLVQ